MITIATWQLWTLIAAIPVAYLLGAVTMACVAMASYDGDKARSEEE